MFILLLFFLKTYVNFFSYLHIHNKIIQTLKHINNFYSQYTQITNTLTTHAHYILEYIKLLYFTLLNVYYKYKNKLVYYELLKQLACSKNKTYFVNLTGYAATEDRPCMLVRHTSNVYCHDHRKVQKQNDFFFSLEVIAIIVPTII